MTADRMAFGHLTIGFDDRLLRPRPWTAAQSHWAAELIGSAPDGPVLELCAGAGHIGLLAIALEPRPLVCVDVNPAARDHILANAEGAGLSHLLEVRIGRLETAVTADERFAMVIADPPWVPRSDVGRYPDDPRVAIDGGDDGLDLARACVDLAAAHLLPGGSALLQLGTADQAHAVAQDLPAGLRLVEVRTFERGVVAQLVLHT